MQWDPGAPTVVLAPHPDDAVLSTWTVLTGPGVSSVLTVCSGVPPSGSLGSFDPLFAVTDSASLMEDRLREDHEALALAGVSGTGLGFLDHQYRSDALDVAAVERAVTVAVTRASRLVAPAAIGDHPDHLAVRDAAVQLSRRTGVPPRPHLAPEAMWHGLSSIPVVGEGLRARAVQLTGDQVDAKLGAIRTYRTQFEALNAGPVGLLTGSGMLEYELYWDVVPVPTSASPGRST
jgi:LmbE family N-acetylglucosaminyl deacetylase